VRRRWPLIAFVALLTALLGYGLSYTVTPQFEASGSVVVLPPKTYELAQGTVNLGTFQNLLLSRAVIDEVVAAQGLNGQPYGLTPAEFVDGHVAVTQVRTGDVLRIAVVLPDREKAAAVVNAIAERAVAIHQELGQREEASVSLALEAHKRDALERVNAAEERLLAFRRSAPAAGAGSRDRQHEVESARLTADYDLQKQLLQDVALRYEKMRMSVAGNAPRLEVLDRAKPPDRWVSPVRRAWALVGFVVGLLGAAALVATGVGRSERPQP
jgi:uncharacterized protein involved in exopolysaccharide biosynthesis